MTTSLGDSGRVLPCNQPGRPAAYCLHRIKRAEARFATTPHQTMSNMITKKEHTINRSPTIRAMIVVAIAGFAVPAAPAQTNTSEARLLRIQPREPVLVPLRALREGVAAPQPWQVSYMFGMAYTDLDAGGHGWSTPLEIDVSKDIYTFTVQSDGYARMTGSPGTSGFSDVLLQVSDKIWSSPAANQKLMFSAGATIPTGGDVGSTHAKERTTGKYTFDLSGNVQTTLSASLRRSEGAATGKNPCSQVIGGLCVYKMGNGKGIFLQVVSAHPNGGDWSSTAIVGHDFPLPQKFSGTISLARGLNKGGEDTSLELDLSW